MGYLIREYIDPEGKNLFRAWVNALDVSTRARIAARIFRFELGNLGDHKHLQSGVWEARVQFGAGYRIYFAKYGDQIVLLLLGGDKSTQRKDIEKACQYWADYKKENSHDSTK